MQLRGLGQIAQMAVTGGGLSESARAEQMRRELKADQARLRAALNGTDMSFNDEQLVRRALEVVTRGLQAANAVARNVSNASDISVALHQARLALASAQLAGSSPEVRECWQQRAEMAASLTRGSSGDPHGPRRPRGPAQCACDLRGWCVLRAPHECSASC